MFVLACLGNPGKKYIKNRHNIGSMLGSYLAGRYGITTGSSSFSSVSGRGVVEGRDVFLIMPQTYMNNSGGPVRAALDYYKVAPARLIVVHDEIELPFGEYRLKFGGGHKGHNGIRSIMQEIGSADFHRVRFGVGRPDNPEIAVADHVLSNFTDEEMAGIGALFPKVTEAVISIMNSGEEAL
jgi:peptidyl-tRNA hydrolase, PTH1 family